MIIRRIIKGDGENQTRCIKISISVSGGAKGLLAVTELSLLIEKLNEMGTADDIITHWDMICGYCLCCTRCGFLPEKDADDLMHAVEMIVDDMLAKAKEEEQ